MKKLVIATANKGKFTEFEYLIRTYGKNFADEIIFAPEISGLVVEETGKTYSENAMLKARAWAEKSGLPCLADDSGLEVEALNGAPGLYSARVADDKISWLLDSLKDSENRSARFVASLALCVPGEFILICEGTCEGFITDSPRGSGGFGYDPVFVPDDYIETFAELPHEIKNSISHRKNAYVKLNSLIANM
ncbi:MAG: RdgB/HAM1 family non-canonical purine NTP pyrophosphatase [Synergistaceae bacterium]|nr:RdgB/HAM1 family non-canonical purine NTP pyrophosphatase [Synergistaceae bacterium]